MVVRRNPELMYRLPHRPHEAGFFYPPYQTMTAHTPMIPNPNARPAFLSLRAPRPSEESSGGSSHDFQARGEFAILNGNLAPKGCTIRLNAFDRNPHQGTAIVFETTDSALKAMESGALRSGHVIVLRLKAKADPVIRALTAHGLSHLVVITDDRYDGPCFGPVISQVTPMAVDGGPIGLVKDDDVIRVDILARRVEMLGPLESRTKTATDESSDLPGFAPSDKYAVMIQNHDAEDL